MLKLLAAEMLLVTYSCAYTYTYSFTYSYIFCETVYFAGSVCGFDRFKLLASVTSHDIHPPRMLQQYPHYRWKVTHAASLHSQQNSKRTEGFELQVFTESSRLQITVLFCTDVPGTSFSLSVL